MKSTLILIIISIAGITFYLWNLNRQTFPVEYGISFSQNHASSLGLDWKETYTTMLKELKPKYIRIAAMWSEVEKKKDIYDFGDVDWMMNEAGKYHARVTLVVGQKAPRWPECHVPEWLVDYSDAENEKYLMDYIEATVNRYKSHPALEFWQVENEPFIRFEFGDCHRYREDLVEEEIALVKSLDKPHKIIITDSGEISSWHKAIKAGDYFGTTLYRIVRSSKGKIWNYDWLPPVFYRLKAALWGRDLNTFFVSELQAEPWFTGAGANETPIEIQEETMNPERLEKHLDYVTHIGVSRAYLWGVEWWYWMKKTHEDSRYWDLVGKIIEDTNDKVTNLQI